MYVDVWNPNIYDVLKFRKSWAFSCVPQPQWKPLGPVQVLDYDKPAYRGLAHAQTGLLPGDYGQGEFAAKRGMAAAAFSGTQS
jgi:hypothetical protein